MADVGLLDVMFRAALDAVDGERLVASFLSRRPPARSRKRGLFACGKAAIPMASGAFGSAAFDEALVVASRGAAAPSALRSVTRYAAHPEPDASSLAAARAALAFFREFGEGDEIVALISGGASSLLFLPRAGLTLAEKRARIRLAMRAGWPIDRLNRLRISLSAIKGGRLAEATRARVTTLVLSDVPGNFRIVGSGPTVSARKRGDRVFLLADNRTGLAAAALAARRAGANVRIERKPVSGEAAEAGRAFAARLRRLAREHAGSVVALLAGGETTVAIRGRAGIGGRNQEAALAAAVEIDGEPDLAILAAGSDGIDGSSKNAGARVDGRTAAHARRRGLDPLRFLAAHDSAGFFAGCGGALVTGPTGTNVADWVFGCASRPRSGALSSGRAKMRP